VVGERERAAEVIEVCQNAEAYWADMSWEEALVSSKRTLLLRISSQERQKENAANSDCGNLNSLL
jgi:hypothetical protein